MLLIIDIPPRGKTEVLGCRAAHLSVVMPPVSVPRASSPSTGRGQQEVTGK